MLVGSSLVGDNGHGMGWSGGFGLIKGSEDAFFKGLELMMRGLEKWLIKSKE